MNIYSLPHENLLLIRLEELERRLNELEGQNAQEEEKSGMKRRELGIPVPVVATKILLPSGFMMQEKISITIGGIPHAPIYQLLSTKTKAPKTNISNLKIEQQNLLSVFVPNMELSDYENSVMMRKIFPRKETALFMRYCLEEFI
uniref:Uncharacterized protein n=1 Tax=Onchocerca volvulus TaxID=6282 RepID=A0A8R1XNA2_ONCVO